MGILKDKLAEQIVLRGFAEHTQSAYLKAVNNFITRKEFFKFIATYCKIEMVKLKHKEILFYVLKKTTIE